MYRKFQKYALNSRSTTAVTATYTVLTTDENIQVTPAANTTLTLPSMATLAAANQVPKAYKISKEGTGRYWVRIVPATGGTIDSMDDIFLHARGDEVILQSSIDGDWKIAVSSVRSFVDFDLEGNKFENMSFRTDALTGQLNAWEVAGVMGVGNVSATGTMSYAILRMVNHIEAASQTVMTARTAFMGLYNHNSTFTPYSGNITVLELENGEAYTASVYATSILTMCTRSAVPTASYHGFSAYITIRDYSTGSGGPIPNLFSLLNASLGWTIPASSEANKTALFAAHAAGTENVTHYLHFSVGGTSYWIHCDATGPAAS